MFEFEKELSGARNNIEFQNFVKEVWKRDISNVQDYELTGMFYQFSVRNSNIKEENANRMIDAIQNMHKGNGSEDRNVELAGIYYPNKKYSELTTDEKAFIANVDYEVYKNNVTLENIKSSLESQKTSLQSTENGGITNTENDLEKDEDRLKDIRSYLNTQEQEHSQDAQVKNSEEQTAEQNDDFSSFSDNNNATPVDSETAVFHTDEYKDNKAEPNTLKTQSENNPPKDPEENNVKTQNGEEEFRLRSARSDENEFLLDTMRLASLYEMKKVSDDEIADVTPEKAISVLNDKLPKLSDKELAELETRMTDKMVENDEVFSLIPPSSLAKAYTGLDERIAQEKDDAKKQDLMAKKEKIGARMTQLTEMLADKQQTNDDLFFADKTNIADVYDGYVEMYDALDKNWRSPRDGGPLAQKMRQGEYMLREEFDKYKDEWNIKNVKSEDADKLQKRYEDLNKKLEGVAIDDDTAKLVSNFKFLDAEGKVEPQFVDKNGNQSDVYTEGAKVIEGSKLDISIRLAKQNILLENIGTDTEFNAQDLQKELAERLPETLYAEHVASQVGKGALEHPKQFTDTKFLNQFKADLANPDKRMEINDTAFAASVDNAVNATAGYASALAQTVGRDKQVAMSVFNPIQDLDKRTNGRFENNTSKKAVRIEMLKRSVKGAASAFLVSGAITTLGTMASADAGLTAATFGLNKMAGMAIGTALAVGMTIKQIHSWRKQQKKEGKPAGLKSLLKDRKMMMTMATTALGATALGFAATGNPGVATSLGMGALALGTANGIISNYADARQGGLGKFESAGWAGLQALSNIAGAYAGRVTANTAINAWNHSHPDSELFQHKEQEVTNRREIVYDDGVKEQAKATVGKWYAGHEDLLQQRVDEINQYNQANGTHIDPYRYLMAAHDAGALAPDNMTLHNQGAPDVASHGNHMVLGAGWSHETGISQDTVGALAQSVGNDGHVNITPASVNAFQQIDGHINGYNQVGFVSGAPYQNDGVLDSNASQNDAGRFVQDKAGDRYTTYADGDSPYKEINIRTTTTHMVDNPRVDGVGMFGVMGNFLGVKELKKRVGALLDKVIKKNKPVQVDVTPPPPPAPTPTPTPTPSQTPVQAPTPAPTPNPKPQENITEKTQNLLAEEYRIVYGVAPDKESKHYKDYVERVEEERKTSAANKTMDDFLSDRREKLDKIILDNIGDTHRTDIGSTVNNDKDGVRSRSEYIAKQARDSRSTTAVVSNIRQSLMQSNLSSDNYNHKVTLSHFTKYAEHAVKQDYVASDASRDISLNPQLKEKYKKGDSKVAVVDLNAYLVEGKTLEQSSQQVSGKDARQAMQQVRRNNFADNSRR